MFRPLPDRYLRLLRHFEYLSDDTQLVGTGHVEVRLNGRPTLHLVPPGCTAPFLTAYTVSTLGEAVEAAGDPHTVCACVFERQHAPWAAVLSRNVDVQLRWLAAAEGVDECGPTAYASIQHFWMRRPHPSHDARVNAAVDARVSHLEKTRDAVSASPGFATYTATALAEGVRKYRSLLEGTDPNGWRGAGGYGYDGYVEFAEDQPDQMDGETIIETFSAPHVWVQMDYSLTALATARPEVARYVVYGDGVLVKASAAAVLAAGISTNSVRGIDHGYSAEEVDAASNLVSGCTDLSDAVTALRAARTVGTH